MVAARIFYASAVIFLICAQVYGTSNIGTERTIGLMCLSFAIFEFATGLTLHGLARELPDVVTPATSPTPDTNDGEPKYGI